MMERAQNEDNAPPMVKYTPKNEPEIMGFPPYKLQCSYYRRGRRDHEGWNKIQIVTINAAQGKGVECSIHDMVLSAKRSERGVGRVNHPKLLNVGLSRSRNTSVLVYGTEALAKDKNIDKKVNAMSANDAAEYQRRIQSEDEILQEVFNYYLTLKMVV